jgi:hypothetical protein
MDDDRTPLITRATLLTGATAVLAGCTRKRRVAPAPTSPSPSASGTPTPPPGASGPVSAVTGSRTPTATATPSPTPSPSPTASPSGDDAALLAGAVAREQALLTAYDKAIRRLPALAPTLRALRAHHQAHADRLQGKGVQPSASGSRRFMPSRPTAATSAVLSTLIDAELGAARAGVSAVGAASPAVSVLLAEIAASEEQHAVLLRWLSGRRG